MHNTSIDRLSNVNTTCKIFNCCQGGHCKNIVKFQDFSGLSGRNEKKKITRKSLETDNLQKMFKNLAKMQNMKSKIPGLSRTNGHPEEETD